MLGKQVWGQAIPAGSNVSTPRLQVSTLRRMTVSSWDQGASMGLGLFLQTAVTVTQKSSDLQLLS